MLPGGEPTPADDPARAYDVRCASFWLLSGSFAQDGNQLHREPRLLPYDRPNIARSVWNKPLSIEQTTKERFLVFAPTVLWLIWREGVRMRFTFKNKFWLAALLPLTIYSPVHGQNLPPVSSRSSVAEYDEVQTGTGMIPASVALQVPTPTGTQATPGTTSPPDGDSQETQSKRILWIIPNYRAVSAETHLPPQSPREI